MKPLIYSLAALALFAAQPAFAAPRAQDSQQSERHAGKKDVESALSDWKDAVESANLNRIMDLYDPSAIMISTFAQEPLTKRAQIIGYFKKVVVNSDIKVEIEDTHPRVFGNVAVNSGQYTLSYTEEGEPVSIPARFSFVYVMKGGKWVIVDQHSSRVPLPTEKK